MIFAFSIGSNGNGKEGYSLHVPFVLSSDNTLSIEGQNYLGEIDGLSIILEKHHYLYSLKISTFSSVSQAQKYLGKIFASLLWVSLKYRLGIKFLKKFQEINMYDTPILVAEKSGMYELIHKAGWKTVDGEYDIDKVTIIPEHKRLTRWELGQMAVTLGLKPESLINDLQQCLQFSSLDNVIEYKKLCLAIELYATYSFEVTFSGKFVKLITVLESLLPEISITDDALALLNEAKNKMKEERKAIKETGKNTDAIDHLISRVGSLSKQSIGYSIKLFISNLLDEFTELGNSEELIPKLISAYDVRSRLLHDGEVDEEALKAGIALLGNLIPNMLTKLFLKYANENCN